MNAHHALKTLAGHLGLGDTEFDADDRLTIRLGDGATMYGARIDDDNIEWSVPLPDLDYADPDMMAVMLEVNCLGAGTGAGRMAVDPDNAAFYGERWITRGMEADEVERRFDELAVQATYWLTEGGDLLLERAQARQAAQGDTRPLGGASDGDAMMLRV